jgi:MFS family permease
VKPEQAADRLYSVLLEEGEDARVCKDIPDEACNVVPGNFFKLVASRTLTKLADELGSPKTVLPWVLSSVGAPASLLGFLVPIRESGSLIPQLAIAAAVRRQARRKYVWILGGILQALALAGIGFVALLLQGLVAGLSILGLLTLFSLARGLASVASKDVTGKTVPKTRRGRLTGFSTALSGSFAVLLGAGLATLVQEDPPRGLLAILLGSAALLWLLAVGLFYTVRETPGATAGGGHGLREALSRLDLLRTDRVFRRFVLVRALLVSTSLAAPFYVALGRESSGGVSLLGLFVFASGLAAALSSWFWGRFADRSSRWVLVIAAVTASTLGVIVFVLAHTGTLARAPWIAAVAYFLLAIAHGGVRVGRKTYILDMAGGNRRTDYVAVSNSVIGVVLLTAGSVGFLSPVIGPGGVLLVLSGLGFAGALGGRRLPEVQ